MTPTGERLSDDRLAWLAVRDRLDQERYRLTWIWILLTLVAPPVLGYFAFGSHGGGPVAAGPGAGAR